MEGIQVLIGELATATGVTAKTLRFYEQQHLLPPPERTASGYRVYRAEAIGRVAFVKGAQAAGLTLRQIAEVLAVRDTGQAPCEHVSRHVNDRLADVEERLRDLLTTRRQLVELRDRLSALNRSDCTSDTICRALQP